MAPKPLLSNWLWRTAVGITALLWLASLVYAVYIIAQTITVGGG